MPNVLVDAVSSLSYSGGVNYSGTHTVANQPNRLGLLVVSKYQNNTFPQVLDASIDGQALEFWDANTQTDGGSYQLQTEIWYIVNPPVGNNLTTLMSMYNTPYDHSARFITLYNVNQAAPFGTPAKNGNFNAILPPGSIADGGAEDLMLDFLVIMVAGAVLTANSPQTTLSQGTGYGAFVRFGMSSKAGGPGVAMGWTNPTGDPPWAHMEVAIRALGAAAPLSIFRRRLLHKRK